MDNSKKEEANQDADMVAANLRAVIGGNLRNLRLDAEKQRLIAGEGKFTLEELAEELTRGGHKVGSGQLGHVEVGRKFPSLPLLVALADYFDTSLDFIVGRTKNQSSIADIEEDLQTGGVSGRMGEQYRKLPANRREEVNKFVQALSLLESSNGDAMNDLAAYKAVIRVIERRHGKENARKAVEEIAEAFPEWRDLVIAMRSTSKEPGIQGG